MEETEQGLAQEDTRVIHFCHRVTATNRRDPAPVDNRVFYQPSPRAFSSQPSSRPPAERRSFFSSNISNNGGYELA